MTNEGDLVFNGVVIPTKPWEAVWNGVAQWFGIETDDDLRTILPNRDTFLNDLWTESDLFTTLPKTTPSVSPSKVPSLIPSSTPSITPTLSPIPTCSIEDFYGQSLYVMVMDNICLKFDLFTDGTLTAAPNSATCNKSSGFGATVYSIFDSASGSTARFTAFGDNGYIGTLSTVAVPGATDCDLFGFLSLPSNHDAL
jgi:hypothetical protein